MASAQTQVVYLNFDRQNPTTDFDFAQASRDAIQTAIEKDYALFDFQFTQAQPVSGDFSTLFFNDGPGFGVADAIDFRNLDRSDNARVQTSTEFGPQNIVPSMFADEAEFLRFTANVASHELGHILGLRHRDSLGPIGSGFSDDPNFLFGTRADTPGYTGPSVADAGQLHLMETSADFANAISQPNARMFDKFYGHREAVKLAFNERGTTLAEVGLSEVANSPFVQTPRQLELFGLEVPNTVEIGDESRQLIDVQAVAVTGAVSAALQRDFFAFEGNAGDLLNIEVASFILGPNPLDANDTGERYSEVIDSRLSVYDSGGTLVPHFNGEATSSNEFEGSPDPFLLDLVLPADDTYYIEVRSDITFDVGNYELFIQSFEAEQAPLGDFNLDGVVDAADYTIWRDTNGSTTDLRADSDFNGKIDELDLEKWADNLGLTSTVVVTPAHVAAGVGPRGEALPGFALASIPEPTTALLTTLALAGCGLRRR